MFCDFPSKKNNNKTRKQDIPRDDEGPFLFFRAKRVCSLSVSNSLSEVVSDRCPSSLFTVVLSEFHLRIPNPFSCPIACWLMGSIWFLSYFLIMFPPFSFDLIYCVTFEKGNAKRNPRAIQKNEIPEEKEHQNFELLALRHSFFSVNSRLRPRNCCR